MIRKIIYISIPLVLLSFVLLAVKIRLAKNDSLTRAHFAQVGLFLQVYYDRHLKLPLILDEAFLIDMQQSGFSSDFYSPRAGFRCECLYFPNSLDDEKTVVVATSIPVGPSIWSFSKRLVVMKLGKKFQVEYIDEKVFQEFLKRRNGGSRIGAGSATGQSKFFDKMNSGFPSNPTLSHLRFNPLYSSL